MKEHKTGRPASYSTENIAQAVEQARADSTDGSPTDHQVYEALKIVLGGTSPNQGTFYQHLREYYREEREAREAALIQGLPEKARQRSAREAKTLEHAINAAMGEIFETFMCEAEAVRADLDMEKETYRNRIRDLEQEAAARDEVIKELEAGREAARKELEEAQATIAELTRELERKADERDWKQEVLKAIKEVGAEKALDVPDAS